MARSGETATSQQILGTCLRMELEAATLYQRFEKLTTDPELKAMWAEMAAGETHHARIIDELSTRRDVVIPGIARDLLSAVVARLELIHTEASAEGLTDEKMLAIAAALEFSEMDDLFGTICQAGGLDPDHGRAEHLAKLVEACVSSKAGGGVLRLLLASLIRLDRRAKARVNWTEEPPPVLD